MAKRIFQAALVEVEKLATFGVQVPRRVLTAAEAAVKALVAEDL